MKYAEEFTTKLLHDYIQKIYNKINIKLYSENLQQNCYMITFRKFTTKLLHDYTQIIYNKIVTQLHFTTRVLHEYS